VPRVIIVLSLLLAAARAWAAPVTFNTALPVAKGNWVWREQLVARGRDDDTAFPDREARVLALSSVLGYGLSERFTLFGVLPYFGEKELRLSTGDGRITRGTAGPGDATLLVRYTAFQWNGQGRTLRVAPLAGVIAPTGDDGDRDRLGRLPRPLQPGAGSWGGLAGVVATYQTLGWQVDGQLAYRRQGTNEGFRPSTESHLDLSFQYRLLPRELGGGVPGFLYGVIESNLVHTDSDRLNGADLADTGGTQWFLTPGLQYVTRRWVLEAAVQLPVQQNMHAGALRDNYIAHVGFRVNF